MVKSITVISLLGALAAQADILTSSQRFFGMGGQIPQYTEENGDTVPTVHGQAPYSPADSDLGVQHILVPQAESEPLIFVFNTSISQTDNAPSGNPATDDTATIIRPHRPLWRRSSLSIMNGMMPGSTD